MTPPRKRARLAVGASPIPSEPPSDTKSKSKSQPKLNSPTSASTHETQAQKQPFTQVTSLSRSYLVKELPLSSVYYVPDFIPHTLSDEWYAALFGLDSWYQPKLKVYGREVTQSRKIAAYSTDPDLILKYSGQIVDMQYTYPSVLREIQDKVEALLGVTFNHVMLNLYEDGGVYIGNHRDNIENKVIASLSLGAPRTFIMTRDQKVKAPDSTTAPAPTLATQTPSKAKHIDKEDKDSAVNTNNKRPLASHTDSEGDNSDKHQEASPKVSALDVDSEKEDEDIKPVNKKTWILNPGSLVVMQGETQKYWKHQIPKEPKVKKGRISLTFRQLVSGK